MDLDEKISIHPPSNPSFKRPDLKPIKISRALSRLTTKPATALQLHGLPVNPEPCKLHSQTHPTKCQTVLTFTCGWVRTNQLWAHSSQQTVQLAHLQGCQRSQSRLQNKCVCKTRKPKQETTTRATSILQLPEEMDPNTLWRMRYLRDGKLNQLHPAISEEWRTKVGFSQRRNPRHSRRLDSAASGECVLVARRRCFLRHRQEAWNS